MVYEKVNTHGVNAGKSVLSIDGLEEHGAENDRLAFVFIVLQVLNKDGAKATIWLVVGSKGRERNAHVLSV